jgi:hypothetical protein
MAQHTQDAAAPAPYGPARTMLEHLKSFAESWGFPTLESAADVIDRVSAREAAKRATSNQPMCVPGPTRVQ